MDTPGSILRTEREKQKVSLKVIADSLKLNIEYLKAIENGEYHLIPAEIYTKAYLRFYAQALGLDAEFITGLYQKQVNASPAKKPPPADNRTGSFSRAVFIVTALVATALTLVVLTRRTEPPVETVQETKEPVAAETYGTTMDKETAGSKGPAAADTNEQVSPTEAVDKPVTQKQAVQNEPTLPKQREPAAPPGENELSPEAIDKPVTRKPAVQNEPATPKQREPAAPPGENELSPEAIDKPVTRKPAVQNESAMPKQQEPAAPPGENELSLKIIATDTVWIAVGIDGGTPQEWLLKSGEKISLAASERFLLKIGNAAGTRVFFNDEDMGKLGDVGQIVELVLPKKND